MRNRPLSGKNFVFPAAFDELLWRGGIRTPEAARLLNRTQRTVRDWRSGARPVPRWAFRLVELTLLDRWEAWGVAPVLWAYPARLDLRFYLPGGRRQRSSRAAGAGSGGRPGGGPRGRFSE